MARNAGWSGSIDETLGTQNAGLPSTLGLQQRQGSRRALERSSLQAAVLNILQACNPPNTILRVSPIVRQTARDTSLER